MRLPTGLRLERGFNALLHYQWGSPLCCDEGSTTYLLLVAHHSYQHCRLCSQGLSLQAACPQHCGRLCFAPAILPHSIGTWDFAFPIAPCEGLCPVGKLWGKGLLLYKADSGYKCPHLCPFLLLCSVTWKIDFCSYWSPFHRCSCINLRIRPTSFFF